PLACARFGVHTGPAHVPCPRELAGEHVERTDDTGRLARLAIVQHPATDDCPAARDRRRRSDEIEARLHFAHAGEQVDLAVAAERSATLTGLRIDSEHASVGR